MKVHRGSTVFITLTMADETYRPPKAVAGWAMKQGTNWHSSRAPVRMLSTWVLRGLLLNAKSAQNTIIKANIRVASGIIFKN